MPAQHLPVLINEAVDALQLKPGHNVIDCTAGGGGHSKSILQQTAPDGKLLAIDLDTVALEQSKKKLRQYHNRVTFVNDNFANLKQIHNEQFSVSKVNGILLDLGISSLELEDLDRGFSFQHDGPLDMRFNKQQSLTAAEIVNTWPFDKLKKAIQEYGQEPLAVEITKALLSKRRNGPITKTKKLVEVILLAYRNKLGSHKEVPWIGGAHPATRTFQALRIAVNGELDNLQKALPQAIDLLEKGGRIAVISFHSLEDRIVKHFFKREAVDCICATEVPVCQCNHTASLNIITKKPIIPSSEEIQTNPRSRSSKLRVAEKQYNKK